MSQWVLLDNRIFIFRISFKLSTIHTVCSCYVTFIRESCEQEEKGPGKKEAK